MKRGCPAGINLSLSDDGQSLVVTNICEDHNHDVNKVCNAQSCAVACFIRKCFVCLFFGGGLLLISYNLLIGYI